MISTPIKQVFNFVSTPENDFQWRYGTLATASLTNGLGTAGTFFRSIGQLMGRRNLSTFEVTEYELDKKYGFKSLSGPLHSKTSYTFESVNGGTRIDIVIQARLSNFFQVTEGTMGKMMKKQLREDIGKLKNVLEAK